jgi:Taurine catabolism dioxygenase TauD, TfdA family
MSIDEREDGFAVHPIAGRIGAEITGLKLSEDLESSTIKAIRDALLKYKVIFFRKQAHLDEESHEAFGRLFGDIVPHPTVPIGERDRWWEIPSRCRDASRNTSTWASTPSFSPAIRVWRRPTKSRSCCSRDCRWSAKSDIRNRSRPVDHDGPRGRL